jgi:hypothetical protein
MDKEYALELARKRLKELDAERSDLHIFIRVHKQLLASDKDVAQTDKEYMDHSVYPGVDIDFTGANNLYERLVRIGQSVEGTLKAKEIALCLIERGESNASPRNLYASIVNQFRDDPDFEKVGRGQYRYVPQTGDSPGEITREMTESSSE